MIDTTHPPTSHHGDLLTYPRRETSTRLVLVHPQGADQAKHVQGVPNPEGVRSGQFLFSAAPPPQGRHARGAVGFIYYILHHSH